ncbi:MAG: DUF2029 domain-containing protein [Candidatus Eremiobacteraeota bacterium]|nr:DUF2029 domain-containing protein [Candidatus Eremiobacteraeota bacterium]
MNRSLRRDDVGIDRFVIWAAVALLVVLVPLEISTLAQGVPTDFVAFWCAGKALLAHRNPYLEGGLHACEVAGGLSPKLTLPVPYPPYVMPLFAAFSLLPLQWSLGLWSAFSIVLTLAAARALQRITALPFPVVFSASACVMLVPTLPYGQVASLSVGCIALAILYVRQEKPVACAIALSAASILPNYALPAWISTWLSMKRSRAWIAVAGAALLIVAVVVMWPDGLRTYLDRVLPAHGRSEMFGYWQFGLSALLHAFGVPDQRVLAFCWYLYAVFVCGGIIAGFRLRQRFGGNEWVVASAAAFGVAGAPFLHGDDLGFALPLVIMLFAAAPDVLSSALLVLMATPWQVLAELGGPQAAIAYPFLMIIFSAVSRGRLLPTAALFLTITVASLTALHITNQMQTPAEALSRMPMTTVSPDALAEQRWTQLNDALGNPREVWLDRAPTYAGFILLIIVAFRATRLRSYDAVVP